MPAPHAYAERGVMNNTWYFTQELAAAHRRDLREMRGHGSSPRSVREFRLPLITALAHRTPKAAPRHACP
jgi:hypothetical protein